MALDLDLGRYQLGWSDEEDYVFKPKKGLNEAIVREMSEIKREPDWMREFRLKAFTRFERKPLFPLFRGMGDRIARDLADLDFANIYYYVKPTEGQVKDWNDLPAAIKNTYERLGIPEAERKYLAGVTAQYECLRGSTRVWTTQGMRRIKELGPGDVVFSLDEGTKQIVTSTVLAGGASGEKEIYEITARGRTIGASGNHPFLVLRNEGAQGSGRARDVVAWVAAEELTVGDRVGIPTDLPEYGTPFGLLLPDRPDAAGLPETTDDELCWWLGVYLGAGWLEPGDRRLTVQIAVETDEAVVEEIRRVARVRFGLELELATDGRCLTAIGTGALGEFFELNGIAGRAKARRLPPWAFGLPRSQRRALLAGLRDAGGTVPDDPGTSEIGVGGADEPLREDVAELSALSGSGHPTTEGTDVARTSDMLSFVSIEAIECVGVEPVYDIEVAGHHNFVAEGFVVHNSEVVFHRNRADLEAKGVLFCDMDTAVREYPDIVRRWFGTVIPPNDNKFAALNSAVWSGGSFIYVPPGVKVDMPLQAYFRINAENMGQFERTLIIADEGSQVHYIEGCSAPVYSTDSLHSAVVELIALPGSRITYTTIQNWSNNVYNLVTKRARAEAEARVEWIDGNIGSRLTMKYPSVYLMGPKASGEVLSVAYAGPGQHQDAGAKMIHAAPETTSTIISKSISKDGGATTYRGTVHVDKGATGAKSFVRCDALLLDEQSVSETKPYMEVGERDASIGHEATVAKIGEDQLFYLMSRGLSESQAMGMIVNGFIEPVTKTLPMEYAVEWSRLIELQMEGSVG
jgi:FeS assembly protein SufB